MLIASLGVALSGFRIYMPKPRLGLRAIKCDKNTELCSKFSGTNLN